MAVGSQWAIGFRCRALLIAILAYGLFSVPAPQSLDWGELLVAGGLLVFLGVRAPAALIAGVLLPRPRLPTHEWIGTFAFLVLLWLPLARGVAHGATGHDLIRDLVPLLFLLLPVMMTAALADAPPHAWDAATRAVAVGLAGAGLAFGLRWWQSAGWPVEAIGRVQVAEGAGYLLNAPAVAFAAAWLPMLGWQRRWPERPIPAVLLIGLGLLLLAGLAAAVHRFTLAAVLTAHAAFARATLAWSPWPFLTGLALAGLLLLPDGPGWGALALLINKTAATGWNARDRELGAVLEAISGSVPDLLFGAGWGALIANPAVGNLRVSFTHSLVTYLLFKTGLTGVLAATAFLGSLVPGWRALLRRDRPLALATAAALAGGLLVHTSFKYLDFGLLLGLCALAAHPRNSLPRE